jgi:hypothetical protein
MKLYLAILLLILSLNIQAQAPSYQGKNFLLEVTPTFDWGFRNFKIPTRTRIEYVFGRHWGIAAFAELGFKQKEVTLFSSQKNYNYKMLYYPVGGELRYYGMLSFDRGLHIAPFGFYWGVGMAQNFGTTFYKEKTATNYQKVSASYFSLSCSMGERSIIAHRLTIDYGLSLETQTSIIPLKGSTFQNGETFFADFMKSSESPYLLRSYLGIGYFIF